MSNKHLYNNSKEVNTMRKAVFWDLQGTLGGEATTDIALFEPYMFSKSALLPSKQNGYLNIVITNQSKISKGLVSMESYKKMRESILEYFNSEELLIDDFLCCPHQNSDHCSCKKPKTGLIDYCVDKYDLDIEDCYVVGDMGKNEIVMAHNAGCNGILVLTGGGQASLKEFRYTWADHNADMIADNAFEAIKMIIK